MDTMESTPSASYSVTLRVEFPHQPGSLGKILTAVGEVGGMVGAVDIVRIGGEQSTRDLTVNARDPEHARQIADTIDALPEVRVTDFSDRTFLFHLGGKIEVRSKTPVRTRDDLSMAYTPGVARVCRAIAEEPERAFNLTIKRNTVAVVSDGTAVLGLGDIGPEAAMPVMEGKVMLFKEFAGVDAFPICLDTKDTDEIVEMVKGMSPGFGGINLEDISAPRDRGAPQEGARDSSVPRRPARHGGGGPGGAYELAKDHRQGDGGPEGCRQRDRGVGCGLHEDLALRRGKEHHRLRLEGHRPRGARGS